MIDYDSRRWMPHLVRVRGTMIREISGRVAGCVVWAAAIVAFHGLSRPITFSPTTHTLVGLALGLLLVFRTNTAYERFWSGARSWAAIVAASLNLGRFARASLAADPGAFAALAAWTSAFHHAAMHRLRGAVGLGLGPAAARLPRDQVEAVLAAESVPLAIALRMGRVVAKVYKEGKLAINERILIESNINTMMDNLSACELIRNTPLPVVYVVHLRRALILYCFTLPIVMVSQYGVWTIPVTLVIAYMFFGIEEIGVEIENPFGTDDNDLPLERHCSAIERSLLALATEDEPPALRATGS